jgi:UDP-glucuronate 4-epimerase
MAISLFTENINNGKPIKVFNNGELSRDFTYIDDIVEGVFRIMKHPHGDLTPPFRVFNIGRNEPVPLMDFIEAIEKALGKKAQLNLMPMQPGDVHTTWADVNLLKKNVDYQPRIGVIEGVSSFVSWWKNYHLNSDSIANQG